MRLRVVACARWAAWNGWSHDRFADVLGLEPRTLCAWQHLVGTTAKPQGAKPCKASPAQRREVTDFLVLWQGCCSLRDLQDHFQELSRGELACLLWAYKHGLNGHARCLRWTCPGAVWAMDFTHADHPIDGIYPYLLVVRDLTTGYVLADMPCHRATGAAVVALLISLFAQHPMPLVIKSDNGSHFVNEAVTALLRFLHITLLLSPPYYPPYNGACEAGMGAIKTRIHHRALRDDNPDRWTSDQVEAARNDVNNRDTAGRGFTPEQYWQSVRAIDHAERLRFEASVDAAIARRRSAADRQSLEDRPALHTLIRRGIADALSGAGYLAYRSRSVHQPLHETKPA